MELKFLAPMDHYARNSRLLESIRSPAYLEYKKVAEKIYKREPVAVTNLEKKMKAIPQRGPYTAKNAGEVASSIPGVTLMGFNAMAEAVEEATDEIGMGSNTNFFVSSVRGSPSASNSPANTVTLNAIGRKVEALWPTAVRVNGALYKMPSTPSIRKKATSASCCRF